MSKSKVGNVDLKGGNKKVSVKKKTCQGAGIFTKYAHNKNSKLYKKKYRGQGR